MNLTEKIYTQQKSGKKMLAALIDPDKITDDKSLEKFIRSCEVSRTDFIFIGGSLMLNDSLKSSIDLIKSISALPVIIFPGSTLQITSNADAILFLSLISGRNPELLIGNHVIAAPYLKQSGIETMATGYILIDCGNATTVSYMSNTQPIPYNKPEIAACTAMAGEMLGLKFIYLDGGSGADKPVSKACIEMVRQHISLPLITGGGIRSLKDAETAWLAGADIVVIGTAFENDPLLLAAFGNR